MENMKGNPEGKPVWKRWWFWVLGLVLLVAVTGSGDPVDEVPAAVPDVPAAVQEGAAVPVDVVPVEEPTAAVASDPDSTDYTDYIDTIIAHAKNMRYAMSGIGQSATSFEEEGYSASWRVSTAYYISLVRQYADEALEIQPPPGMEMANNTYREAMNCYLLAMDYYEQGLGQSSSDMDPRLIEMSTEQMLMGNEYVRLTTEGIVRWSEK